MPELKYSGSFKSTGSITSFSELKGKKIALYFYPKDSTPGCTRESCDFRDNVEAFANVNTVIIGVSRDGLKSHENFKTKQNLPFDLISDSSEEVCKAFRVITSQGRVQRSSFLIDEDGKIIREWRGVKVPGHVAEVLKEASGDREETPAEDVESSDEEPASKRSKKASK